jgi:peptide/nickel transport system substrate-binding protein
MTMAGCRGDDEDDGGGEPRKGGSIRIGTTGPDKYDPVLNQTVQALQVLQLVYTPLISYKHEEGEAGNERVPALAEALTEVSNGGRTYRLTLREGMEYSRRQRSRERVRSVLRPSRRGS